MPTRSGGGGALIWPPSRCVVPEARQPAPRLVAPEARQMAQQGGGSSAPGSRNAVAAFGPAPAASLARPFAHADSCARPFGCLQRGYGVGAGGALAPAAARERREALGLQPHRLQLGPLPLGGVEEVASRGPAGAERLRARH